MPYFLKMVSGKTYDLQGIQFKLGDEKEVPKHVYDYAVTKPQFEGRVEEDKPTTDVNEMDLESLVAFAEANQINLGKASSEEGVRHKIKEHLKKQNTEE